MKPYRHYFVCLAATALLGLAHAGDGRVGPHDHDRARQAVTAGEVLPLKVILEQVVKDHPGEVMEVELEHEGGRWIYEIKLLRSGGSLVKLKFNARDGTLLRSKAREPSRGKDNRSREDRH